MRLIDPASPRRPVSPEAEMASGDAPIPPVLDPRRYFAVQRLVEHQAAAADELLSSSTKPGSVR